MGIGAGERDGSQRTGAMTRVPLLDSVYLASPAVLQHALTTMRGLYLRHMRYTAHTWKTLAFLTESQYWPADRMEAYQLQRLKSMVDDAMRNSPHYKQSLAEKGLNVHSITSLRDLCKFPIVSRAELRRDAARFVRTDVKLSDMWVANTSGTSGSPLSAHFTHKAMQERMAFLERLYGWYTPGRWRKRASFTGKLMVDPNAGGGSVHRSNLSLRQQLYSSHHLKPAWMQKYVNELNAFQPDQIDGIASPIYMVADFLMRSDQVGVVRPRVVIPTSETIWPHIRERMERAFTCKVANQYGSQEGAPIAYECPAGGFHTCPESGVFEILRPDDEPCNPGETGRLVVTSFLSEGMPLIRYDIGDAGSWRGVQCSCGRPSALIDRIEGRIDDMFFTRERGVVTRVDSAFKGLPNSIIAAQVAQLGIDHFELRIIPDPESFSDRHGHSVVEHLHQYLGTRVRIEMKIVSEIARTSGGKQRAMVNECSDPEVRMGISNGWNASEPR